MNSRILASLLSLSLLAPQAQAGFQAASRAAAPARGMRVPAIAALPSGLGVAGAQRTSLSTPALSAGANLPGAASPLAAPGAAAIIPGSRAALSAAEPTGPQGQGAPKSASQAANPKPAATPSAETAPPEAAQEAGAGSFAEPEAPAGTPELSAEAAKAAADARFDKQRGVAEAGAPVQAAPARRGLVGSALNRLATSRVSRIIPKALVSRWTAPPKLAVKTVYDKDEHGGPQQLKLSAKGQALYGMRWGLTMIGMMTIIQQVLGAIFKIFPWQLNVDPQTLSEAGRIELMVGTGPRQIVQALQSDPLGFLFLQLPMATAVEEIMFRLISFGLTFIVLANLRRAAGAVSSLLDHAQDLFGLRRFTQRMLGLAGWISSKAFPIAAILSTKAFVIGHFAAWGINPVIMAVHAAMGFTLAYVAYKTRSLWPAITAHLTYNLLTLTAVWLAINSIAAGGLLLSVVSVVALYLHWRSAHKAKTLTIKQARMSAGAAIAGLALMFMSFGGAAMSTNQTAVYETAAQKQQWVLAESPIFQSGAPAQQASSQVNTQSPPAAALETPAIVAKVKPAVLKIITQRSMGTAVGSGFVIAREGFAMTNAHVVRDAVNGFVQFQFADGRHGMAKVVAVNDDKDIAIIMLPPNPNGWPTVALADSDALVEGEEVLAMGHPRDLPFTVTHGIISGIGARGNLFVQQLQTDAPINPGNSGGLLVNKAGEVIGMNTMILKESTGLGFAIVSRDLADALMQFAATGNINSSWLGVIIDMTSPVPPSLGVRIEEVRPGSPAAKAGLRSGDIILGAGDLRLGSNEEAIYGLASVIARTKPGGVIPVAVGRDGGVFVIQITLADKPSN